MVGVWTGFSEQPAFVNARAAGEVLVRMFTTGSESTVEEPAGDQVAGVDEIHLVYTEFRSMLNQVPVAKRIAPIVVEQAEEAPPEGYLPAYEFEPEPEALLDALLPKYLNTRISAARLESAAAEAASRRLAMKTAADNGHEC